MAEPRRRIFPCVNSPDLYCYICGLFTPVNKRKNVTDEIRKEYYDYFNIHINQNNHWTPTYICGTCEASLNKWSRNQGKLSFGTPMIWREPVIHSNECYFCAVSLRGIKWERRNDPKWYGNVTTVTKPEPHSQLLPVPIPPNTVPTNTPSSKLTTTGSGSASFVPSDDDKGVKLFNQDDLDDLVRDLYLSKQFSELIASRLKDRNMLEKGSVVKQQ